MNAGSYKINDAEYHSGSFCDTPLLSRSIIKEILKCPAKAYVAHPRLNPNYKAEEKEEFDLGSAAHDLLLRGLDNVCVIDADSWRTKDAKAARDAARKEGKFPLLEDKYKEVKAMVEAAQKALVESELKISNLQTEGDAEMTYVWQENEAWCCCRLDWIRKNKKLILDYKTTGRSAYPEDFAASISDNGYDIQERLYAHAVEAVDGKEAEFIFLVQETEPPYLCTFVSLDFMFRDMAEQKIMRGTEIWRECLSRGVWPGYSQDVYTIEPKSWNLAQWEMRKAGMFIYGGEKQ